MKVGVGLLKMELGYFVVGAGVIKHTLTGSCFPSVYVRDNPEVADSF